MKYLTNNSKLSEQLLIETVAQPNGVIVVVKDKYNTKVLGTWLNTRKDLEDKQPMKFPCIYDDRAKGFLDICNELTDVRDLLTVLDDEIMYLDYFNNYLTLAHFADSYGLTEEKALEILTRGRELNNNNKKAVTNDSK